MKIQNKFKFLIVTTFLISIVTSVFAGITATRPLQFLIVSEEKNNESGTITYNIARTLKDASLHSDLIDIDKLPDYTFDDLNKYSAIILSSEKATRYFYSEDAIKYLNSGGIIVCATYCWSEELMKAIGIEQLSDIGTSAKGLETIEPLFKNEHLKLSVRNFSYWSKKFKFSNEWKTLIKYKEPDMPMLLTRNFGEGKIVYWNTSALTEKFFRGFFLFSLLRALPVAAMSVHNATLLHLDDSPPPAYNIMEGPVARDLGFHDKQFYFHRWIKEVLPFLDENKLVFTAFVCFRYDGKIEGKFYTKSDREPFFTEFLNVHKKRHDDMALHGYNHQSLTMGESPATSWKSAKSMNEAVKACYKMWDNYNLPTTLLYVPPNNVIDINGKLALAKEFPSIRVICGLYNDNNKHYEINPSGYIASKNKNSEKLKLIYSLYASRRAMMSPKSHKYMKGDEFGVDPEVPSFLNLPRMSSGHFLTPIEKMLTLNGIMAYGLVNHFFHPDDIYDPSRRGRSWEHTLAALRHLVIFWNRTFKFARRITTSDFIYDFKKYIFSTADIKSNNSNKIEISSKGRKYYYIFSAKPINKPQITNGKLEAIIEKGHLFLIKLGKEKATIDF